jgi:hypothetical protein
MMALATRIPWNGDGHVTHLVMERVKIKLRGRVHRLHQQCDQEQPKKAWRKLSVGF